MFSGREDLTYWQSADYDAALEKCREDDARRARDFFPEISGSLDAGGWLDFGTGLGGVAHQFLGELQRRRQKADGSNRKAKEDAGDNEDNEEESRRPRIGVVEVQKGALEALHRHLAPKGVEVYRELAEIPDPTPFRLVTLFHVFEHLDRPIETLKSIKEKMVQGGQLIVEGE